MANGCAASHRPVSSIVDVVLDLSELGAAPPQAGEVGLRPSWWLSRAARGSPTNLSDTVIHTFLPELRLFKLLRPDQDRRSELVVVTFTDRSIRDPGSDGIGKPLYWPLPLRQSQVSVADGEVPARRTSTCGDTPGSVLPLSPIISRVCRMGAVGESVRLFAAGLVGIPLGP